MRPPFGWKLALLFLVGCAVVGALIGTIMKLSSPTKESRSLAQPLDHRVRPGSADRVPHLKAGVRFTCTPERLWDGDGPIWCAEGPRVRLAGIAAREIDDSCRAGHPCPDVSGAEARRMLAAVLGEITGEAAQGHLFISGPALQCTSEGSAGGERTAAWCVSPTYGDISCKLIRDGSALKWDRYWQDHSC